MVKVVLVMPDAVVRLTAKTSIIRVIVTELPARERPDEYPAEVVEWRFTENVDAELRLPWNHMQCLYMTDVCWSRVGKSV
jgi:hypothetical protein